MIEVKKQIILDSDGIEKLNDYSCDLGTFKRTYKLFLESYENEVLGSEGEIICLLYVMYSYVEKLKNDIVNFLEDHKILL